MLHNSVNVKIYLLQCFKKVRYISGFFLLCYNLIGDVMTEFDYKSFAKRYHKYKDCNLPVPFWDEERQVKEYVYYEDREDLEDWKKYNVSESIFESLSDIAFTGLYYSFTCGGYTEKDSKFIKKVEHNHAHSFEEVVKCLYDYPETFNISTEEEEFYSKQELKYLRRVQKSFLWNSFQK